MQYVRREPTLLLYSAIYICCCRLDVALDLEILATEPYTGDYFLQEIKGLADATGVDYKALDHSLTMLSFFSLSPM